MSAGAEAGLDRDRGPAPNAGDGAGVGRLGVLLSWLLASAVLAGGWWLFDYLCDDAYIAFRYVHNLLAGRGLVWNPAPFQPVEGYTSLLWVLILGAVWKVTGLDPTVTANPLLLVCSMASLGVAAWMACSLRLSGLAPYRSIAVAAVLFGTATNLTFVQWSTSGLEQALNTLLVLTWFAIAAFRRRTWTTALALTSVAALLELARPDGLLFLAATVAWVGAAALAHPNRARTDIARWLPSLAPLAVPAAHLLWRHATYGEWLPNTYFAKHAGPWPRMGALYFAGFVLEYAYFLWVPPALGALWAARRRQNGWRTVSRWDRVARAIAPLAVAGHFLYYTLSIGGDHFGFRIYHHLVPLLLLALVVLVDRARWRPRLAVAWIALALVAGNFIPWTHWAITRDAKALQDAGMSPHALRPHLPQPLATWAAAWDRQQRRTRAHMVGLRHRAHQFNIERQVRRYPPRPVGSQVPWNVDDIPVHEASAVGYPGWVLPDVAILDELGLNDAVVAHTPVPPDRKRRMAHDRYAPAAYLRCFRPNVFASDGATHVRSRRRPLTADDVAACEARFWAHGPLPRPPTDGR